MPAKVCCFGELMLRLSPGDNWLEVNNMPFYVGGSELNVAVALAQWQIPVKYLTALPDNFLSRKLIGYVGSHKIAVSDILLTGNRIGIYYLPQGSEIKGEGVIYDRAYSSFSTLMPGMIDWETILSDCNWFHFSAISPSLNKQSAAVCAEALAVCSKRNIPVSIDLNYRSKLWSGGGNPVDIMHELLNSCDVVMGNIWSAQALLGIESSVENSTGKSDEALNVAAAESIMQLRALFPKVKTAAYTYRLDNRYFACISQDQKWAVSKSFTVGPVVDRVGSGDCFMAGLIYGLSQNSQLNQLIDFAAAAAVGKLNETGDFTRQTCEDITDRVKFE